MNQAGQIQKTSLRKVVELLQMLPTWKQAIEDEENNREFELLLDNMPIKPAILQGKVSG